MSKKDLAVELSRLEVFNDAKLNLEQYSTDSEVAASILWNAHMHDWIQGKIIADLGAGTGILGIGCLLLGAKKVIFVEKDKESIKSLLSNLETINNLYEVTGEVEILNIDVRELKTTLESKAEREKIDLIVENPPFGTQEKNCDALFLEIAMELAPRVITMHKTVTKDFISQLARNNNFLEYAYFYFKYPLKMTLAHHKKAIEYIKVSCWFFEKEQV